MNQLKQYLPKTLIVVSVLIGLITQSIATGNFMGSVGSMFLFFTVQSNIFIGALALVMLIMLLMKKELPVGLLVTKHVFTVAIVLTYVVFTLLLAPSQNLSYLLSPENLFLHTFTPIVAVVDYFLNDRFKPVKQQALYGLILPMLYFVFAYVVHAMGIKFGNFDFPYFFLDYETLGWFTIGSAGLGVAYWVVIVSGFVWLISYGLLSVKKLDNKWSYLYVAGGMLLVSIIVTGMLALN